MTFDVAADAYDRFMGGWSIRLAPRFADFANVRPGQRVLDVGCGPGALTGELVARVGPEAVCAADPSVPFVEAARARHPGVDVRQAAAEALPFPPATFDASLAQLVVHFLADPVGGLREMARVTRSDGTVAACVWDFAGGRGPLGPFWEAASAVAHGVVGEANLAGARAGHLEDLLREAGLEAIEAASIEVARPFESFDAWWEPFTRGVGPAGSFVAGLGSKAAANLRELCRRMLPAGAFELRASAWAARGRVPTAPGTSDPSR